MATPTVAEFRELFAALQPQLLQPRRTALIDTLLLASAAIVDDLRPALDPAGDLRDLATAYLCAHFLDPESGSRPRARRRIRSIDRDSLVRASDPLHSTRWGRAYLSIIAGRASTGGVGVFESPSP